METSVFAIFPRAHTQKRLVVDSTIDSVARTNFTTVHIFPPTQNSGFKQKNATIFHGLC